MFRTILIALVFSGLVVGGQAKAEVIDGSKLFADCRDGDNPSARDSTSTVWQTRWFPQDCIVCRRG
jgi:hypothetical protein